MRQSRTTLKGFTLIEIMVAVGLLIVLAVLLIGVAAGLDNKGKITKTQAQMKVLSEAVKAFHDAKGYFPIAVPEDAWQTDWNDINAPTFVDYMNWRGRWTQYFQTPSNPPYRPVFQWSGASNANPTNIQMLAFQLEQVPQASKYFGNYRETYPVDNITQKYFTATSSVERWALAAAGCQIAHPLDATGNYRQAFQPQDAWGTPLRFWTTDTLKWARATPATPPHNAWNPSIQSLLATQLQQANGGFFIESAGKDGKFGWCGDGTPPFNFFNSKDTEDNLYSVGQ